MSWIVFRGDAGFGCRLLTSIVTPALMSPPAAAMPAERAFPSGVGSKKAPIPKTMAKMAEIHDRALPAGKDCEDGGKKV